MYLHIYINILVVTGCVKKGYITVNDDLGLMTTEATFDPFSEFILQSNPGY